jgi:hypothetical protein
MDKIVDKEILDVYVIFVGCLGWKGVLPFVGEIFKIIEYLFLYTYSSYFYLSEFIPSEKLSEMLIFSIFPLPLQISSDLPFGRYLHKLAFISSLWMDIRVWQAKQSNDDCFVKLGNRKSMKEKW